MRRYNSNPGFVESLTNSFFAIFIGIFLIFGSFYFLWWNEGRAVTTARSLDEGMRLVTSLSSSNENLKENEGKLIHFGGRLNPTQQLADSEFSVSARATKFVRRVEMFQWKESKTEIESKQSQHNGEVVEKRVSYSYALDWSSDHISSTNFNDKSKVNPSGNWAIQKRESSSPVQVGQFTLTRTFVDQIQNFRTIGVDDSSLKRKGTNLTAIDNKIYTGNPFSPRVGDLKIWFEVAGVEGEEVSLIGQQKSNRLVEYQTNAGDQLAFLEFGSLSAQEMFESQQAQNQIWTWIYRAIGWLLVWIGISMTTSFISVIASYIPILGGFINFGLGLANFLLSLIFCFLVVGLAWFRFRPLLSLSLLIASAGLFYLMPRKETKKN
eukprot:TRINITY_DN3055_c0_g1_i1.p1 TRINITY_DN3055_c0_g1~~TRINITY_DN3055_c0_g1_i1.p1  ORF type:complete len:409 (-),score=140.57 TRINITY_DN3055_c0_g1_i1:64-1203(-)